MQSSVEDDKGINNTDNKEAPKAMHSGNEDRDASKDTPNSLPKDTINPLQTSKPAHSNVANRLTANSVQSTASPRTQPHANHSMATTPTAIHSSKLNQPPYLPNRLSRDSRPSVPSKM